MAGAALAALLHAAAASGALRAPLGPSALAQPQALSRTCPPAPLSPRAPRAAAVMDGETPDDLVEYSLRMLGFGASAVAGLVFTIFIGPIQAFSKNPKTAGITAAALAVVAVALLVTLRSMTGGDPGMPREAVEQAGFADFVPPRLD
mmetsp:Transcript_21781/g.73276  ORF Transcript_21781/g.73276 Transcript_21781/m.73276 type:complete len:147 (-) Transcript_21781:79-519(-)